MKSSLILAAFLPLFLAACATTKPAPLTLNTTSVQIVGTNARLEKTAVEEHVGYWNNTNTFAQWSLKNLKPGTYNVKMIYSLDPQFPPSIVTVSARGQSLSARLSNTKNWDDYHALDFGSINIQNPSDSLLTVKATAKPGEFVMNLQQVILTPQPH